MNTSQEEREVGKMTYEERNNVLNSSAFKAQCRIALCDWLEYWSVNGTDSIEDSELRMNTDLFIKNAISNVGAYSERIAVIVIGSQILEDAEEITDDVVMRAVNNVLSNALTYLL